MITSHKKFVSIEALAKVSSPSAFIGDPGFKVIENQWIPAKKLCGNDNKKSFARASIFLIFLLSLFIFITGCGGGGGSDVSLPPITGNTPTGDPSDTTPPQVTSTYPSNGATGFPLNSAISATFSEAMNTSTINNTTFTLSGITGTVSYSGTTAYFTPSSNLSYSTTYTATITTGVKDLAGNQMGSNYTWTFTTGDILDTTPPTVSSTSPASSATNVAVNSAISATFSEAMTASSVTTATFTVSGATGTVTYSGTIATFKPSADLAPNTSYAATIAAGVKDLADNQMKSSYSWSFETGTTSDTTAPTDPAGLTATAISPSQIDLSWTASTDSGGSGLAGYKIERCSGAGCTNFAQIATTTSNTYSDTGLTANTSYSYQVRAYDNANNNSSYSNTASVTTLDTTTPTVLSSSISPSNGAINVVVNTLITAVFSETMDGTTFTSATFTLTSGAGAVSGIVSFAGDTATFTPTASLSYSTTYTATITTGVKDLAGNQMAANYTWTFTTEPAAILTWGAPTTNEDGTDLTDLEGYKVYYGTSSGSYTTTIDAGNVTTYTVTGLSTGTYYFAVTAVDTSGNESIYSNEVSKTIQ